VLEDELKVKCFGSLLGFRLTTLIGCAWLCMGCGAYTVVATDGAVFQQSGANPDPLSSALKVSAARDLPCESDVEVQRLEAAREYAVSGCGGRVLYHALSPSLSTRRLDLVSRSAWPASHVASLTSTHTGGDPPPP
jgi:hypothetical protein